MNDLARILLLQNFGTRISRDQRQQKLHRALAPHCLDGTDTEIHGAVDRELRGLETQGAAAKIKDAIERKTRNTVPVDVVVEIVGKLFEPEDVL